MFRRAVEQAGSGELLFDEPGDDFLSHVFAQALWTLCTGAALGACGVLYLSLGVEGWALRVALVTGAVALALVAMGSGWLTTYRRTVRFESGEHLLVVESRTVVGTDERVEVDAEGATAVLIVESAVGGKPRWHVIVLKGEVRLPLVTVVTPHDADNAAIAVAVRLGVPVLRENSG